ncbi:5,10-methylenetetrahydrofolate reductase [Paramagnetospirillum caucaseum]|uniref:Methylenetetrahydrofolate reductase n=1 Tax=Paramagnetospirillum caucaseum TaxID=1244869 RepID=M3AA53_9PROT|nr:methylenetetrahydrofolate reductase C-terminal domain-containing protein [Paramagnetospirillum caucaseum]EME69623.1 5,10-methylenetetrahydrofolate reductase [Paramagnetospirillum caucaseum]
MTPARWHQALSLLRPLVSLIGRRRLEQPLAWAERALKRRLFGCRMCGQCALDATGMGCPMRCPKGLRNGPCGGVRSNGTCELDASMACAWKDIWSRLDGELPPRQPLLDHRRAGRSAWLAEILDPKPAAPDLPPDRAFAKGRLQARLEAGDFVVTAEIGPGTAADGSALLAQAGKLGPWVDAINVTDGSAAHCALSSMAAAALLRRAGHDAVMQMTCRDRNRIALQNDLLGAAALGIENVVCLTGDGVLNGDHPEAKPVFDLDAVALVATAKTLRDGGRFLSGRALTVPPGYFIGAVDNPFAPPEPARVQRLAAKVAAGAQFVQTQYVFDIPAFTLYMERLRAAGLHRRCHVIAGVGMVASARTARWLTAKVPGVRIPDGVVRRLEQAADPVAEGAALAVELIGALRRIDGVAGVHLMFHHHLEMIEGVITAAGLAGPRQRRRVA